MYDIEAIKKERKIYDQMLFQSHAAFKTLDDFDTAAFNGGCIPKKYKELMGLAVSLNVKCYPCVQYHVEAALKAGATREEIIETLVVSVAMGGAITQVVARFAMKTLERWERNRKL